MINKIKSSVKHIEEKIFTIPEYFWKRAIDYKVAELLLNHVIYDVDNPVITYEEQAV